MICNNCGEVMEEGAKYCANCGMPVGSGPFEPENIEKELAELYGPPEIFGGSTEGEPTDTEETVDTIVCSNCGYCYIASAKYCPECGMDHGNRFDEKSDFAKIQLLYGPPEVFDKPSGE